MSEITTIENGKVKLTFKLSAEDYTKALNAAYHRIGARYAMPGFRNGKAPRRMIEKQYGDAAFWDKELDMAVEKACADAVAEHKLLPALAPEYSIISYSETEGCEIEATLVLEPTVELGQYKGIEVPMQEYNVTDEMVEKELDKRRHEQARQVSVEDRPLELGDTAVFDFVGFVDGEQFEGGTAEKYSMVIGSHQFIPGFEEQMVGMKIGEERDVNVTFPENYQAEHLKGKPAVFKVKLHELSYEELPELNDEFAAETSEFETLDELKADVRRELGVQMEKDRQIAFESAAIQQVIDNAKVVVHPDLIAAEAHAELHNMEHQLSEMGLKLEDYANYMGTTVEEMHDRYHHIAEDQIKARTVIQAVIDAEKIEPADADYEAAVNAYAERSQGWTPEKVAEELLPENRMKYAQSALYEAVIRFIKENAVITKKEEKVEE
ncbi:MAG: trigger factor [Clostridiales bacterium]|nr:trigger factor [Clostridiales bacterium]